MTMTLEDFEKKLNEQNNKSKEKEADPADREFGLKLVIDSGVYAKIMHWVNKSDFEVSGLGSVVHDPTTNTLRVTEAFILPQKNSGTTTDIEPAAVNKLMFLHHQSGAPGKLKFWWHSHVNMGVFWSGTDIDTIKKLGSGGWFCATVFNKRREVKSSFCQNEPVRLLLADIPTEVSENAELAKQWDADYDKNVENVKYGYSPTKWDPSNLSEDEQEEIKEFLRRSQKDNEKSFKEGKEEDKEVFGEAEALKRTKVIMIDGQEVQMEMFKESSKKNLVPVQKKGIERIPFQEMDATTSLDDEKTNVEQLNKKSLEDWQSGQDDNMSDFTRRWFGS